MRTSLLAPLALLLPVLPAAAAEPAKAPPAAHPAETRPAESNASASPSGDGSGSGAGAKGLVFGFNELPTVGGFYHLNSQDSLRLNVGFKLNFKPGFNAEFSLEPAFRHHLLTGNLRPFVEGGIAFGYAGDINFALRGGLGVEYYFVPRVSVSGVVGAALRFDNGGGSISLPLGTTAVLLNVYL